MSWIANQKKHATSKSPQTDKPMVGQPLLITNIVLIALKHCLHVLIICLWSKRVLVLA